METFIWICAGILFLGLIILTDIIITNYRVYHTHKCPNCGKYMEFSHIKRLPAFIIYVFKCPSCGTIDEIEGGELLNNITDITT